MVGQAIADRLTALGHQVIMGTRNVADTLAKTEPDRYGNPSLSTWLQTHPGVNIAPFAEAARQASIIFNCTNGNATPDVLKQAGEDNLAGKTLIDIANPLDFSNGFPPSLSVCNTDSLAEQIQRAFPAAKVVKTLNTMTAMLMVNPALLPGEHSVFVSGNDSDAKQQTVDLLTSFSWPQASIIDLGDLSTARATEMLLPIWTRLYGALKTPLFNFNVNIAH